MRKAAALTIIGILLLGLLSVTAFAADGYSWSDEDLLTPGTFSIDGAYLQEGMNAPYEAGYAPDIRSGALQVVLPLLAADPVDSDIIYCGLDLGSREDSPFTYQNYRSIPVRLRYPDAESEDYNPYLYVADFDLPLKSDRKNGVYPLGVSIRYRVGGKELEQLFTIDFTVTDGMQEEPDNPGNTPGASDPGNSSPGWSGPGGDDPGTADPGTSDPGIADPGISGPAGSGGGAEGAVSEPKVILESAVADPNPAQAGEPFTVVCTLRNTSKQQRVSNMTVTYKSQTTDLIPLGGASTQYIEAIGADSTVQFAFQMESRLDAQSGPQKIDLSLSYEGKDGSAYTAADEITVQIRQQVRLEYDEPQFPLNVFIGDSINTSLNLFNKGKGTLYNVTVSLDVPGIDPEASAFIGNMESGTSKSADIYANVVGLEDGETAAAGGAAPFSSDSEEVVIVGEGEEPAEDLSAAEDIAADMEAVLAGTGETSGEFLITYEDEFGEISEEHVPVSTDIMPMEFMEEPVTEPEEPEPEAGFPWWGWALIGGGAAGGAAVPIVRSRRRRRAAALEEEDDELY